MEVELTLTTPALLFPAISLLMLAYTNRFIVLAQLVRDLHREYTKQPNPALEGQINNLRSRIVIIKNMQIYGALSFFFCVACGLCFLSFLRVCSLLMLLLAEVCCYFWYL